MVTSRLGAVEPGEPVFLGQDASGRQRYLTRTIHGTKREADEQLRELMLEAGLAHGTSQATMDNLAAKWLEMAAETLSPSTLREYRRLLTKIILPQFASMKVRVIRPSDLDSFYARLRRRGVSGRPLSGQCVHHVHALIRRLLNQALKWGWIMVNPAINSSPPRVNRPELEIPNVEVVTRIINFAKSEVRTLRASCDWPRSPVRGAGNSAPFAGEILTRAERCRSSTQSLTEITVN